MAEEVLALDTHPRHAETAKARRLGCRCYHPGGRSLVPARGVELVGIDPEPRG